MRNIFKLMTRNLLVLVLVIFANPILVFAQLSSHVRVKVYAQHVGNRVIYYYRIINNSPNHIAAIWIGHDDQNDKNRYNDVFELRELPAGWTFANGIPADSASSPPGWTVKVITPEETPTQAIEWSIMDLDHQHDVRPGQALGGMSVVLEKADERYITGHALIILSDGYPKSFTIPLEKDDTIAPTLSVDISPNILWPPNDKQIGVIANITVNDDYDPQPELRLESITANETLDSSDIGGAQFGTDDRQFHLAAKRSGGNKDGRIYTITYSATDASGNKATASATVTVPHDQGIK